MTVLSRMKQEISRRWPRAVAAYHALRTPVLDAGNGAQRTPQGFLFVGPEAMRNGTFEPAETAVIGQLLRSQPVFIDVGANVGYFVCLARQHRCHVVAIEPMAQNLGILYRNLLGNGWADTEVLPLGVGAVVAIQTIYGSGTAASLLVRWAGTSDLVRQTIALSTLDTLIDHRFTSDVLVIKIDVEGAELDVLLGAKRLMARSPRPAWVVEVCLTENHPAGVNPHFAEVFRLFRDSGYEARAIGALDRVVSSADVARWVASGQRDYGSITYLFADAAMMSRVTGGLSSA